MLIPFLKHHVGREDLTGRNSPHVHGVKVIDLCTEPGNRMRLFIVEDADTYGNYIPTNEYLMDEDDGHYEVALHREERRADVCSAMSIPLHTSPYEIRMQVLYGTVSLVSAVLEDDEEGLLRAVAPNDSGTPVAVLCCKRVEDSHIVKLTTDDERIIDAAEYRTIFTSGATAWIEYERGEADPNFNATQYSYATDGIIESVPVNASNPISPQDCMVLIARVIGLANEAALRKEQAAKVRRTESENRERAEAARTCLALNPDLAAHNPNIRMNSANVSLLAQLTGAHDEHVLRLYPLLSSSQWREWLGVISQVRALNTTRFLTFALNILTHRIYAAGIATPQATEGTPSNPYATVLDEVVPAVPMSDAVNAFIRTAGPVPTSPAPSRNSSRAFTFADQALRNFTEREEQMRRMRENALAFTAQATNGRPN